MAAIRLVCWKPELARERARRLEEAGYVVNAEPLELTGRIRQFRQTAPSAVVIDLDRLPSNGREVAVVLRNSEATRRIPIVFAGGPPEKVERIRRELPDAFFTDWSMAAKAVGKALKHPPAEPVRPIAHMDRYGGSSLMKKLGFRPKMKVALVAAPEGFDEKLGELPEGVELADRITRSTEMALWFVRSRNELESQAEYFGVRLRDGASLWIVHPKKAGRYKVDFNQNDVRKTGLAIGLVDYKVCAIDDDWSGLKFARKKTN